MAFPSTVKTEPVAARLPRIGLLGWLRFSVRLALLLLLLAVLVPLQLITRALGKHAHWPRLFLGSAARIMGARVEIAGPMVARNVFFLPNHSTWLDILIMGGATGTAFIGKAELRDTPVIGWLCDQNRTLYVSREDKMGVAGQIAMVRDALAENHAITVFPEGTTTDGQSLLPFKTSLLAVLEPPPPGMQVQPVLISYGTAAPDIVWVGDEPGLHNGIRVLARAGHFTVRLEFLAPFDPQELAGRKAIAARARGELAAALSSEIGRHVG